MQHEQSKASKITIRPDRAIGFSSKSRGAYNDSIGFNIRFILERRPRLAVELIKLFREAGDIHPGDPHAPEQDVRAAVVELEQATGQKIL